jgi:hypothetical protein
MRKKSAGSIETYCRPGMQTMPRPLQSTSRRIVARRQRMLVPDNFVPYGSDPERLAVSISRLPYLRKRTRVCGAANSGSGPKGDIKSVGRRADVLSDVGHRHRESSQIVGSTCKVSAMRFCDLRLITDGGMKMALIPLRGQGRPLPADFPYQGDWLIERRWFLYVPDAQQQGLSGASEYVATVPTDQDELIGWDAAKLSATIGIATERLYELNRLKQLTIDQVDTPEPGLIFGLAET